MSKFFRHFKGKPYRYLGTAKFSENLQEMVVYETMYDNPEGKLWVRPRTMFEETVERGGISQPRFRAVSFEITALDNPDERTLVEISGLAAKILDPLTPEAIRTRLTGRAAVLIQTCRLEGRLVGFKIGYAESSERFYSWLGGVDPDFHRLGIASSLITAQQQWCREHGYREIETRTTNDHPGMLILNVRHGYRIAGTCTDSKGRLKILMTKAL